VLVSLLSSSFPAGAVLTPAIVNLCFIHQSLTFVTVKFLYITGIFAAFFSTASPVEHILIPATGAVIEYGTEFPSRNGMRNVNTHLLLIAAAGTELHRRTLFDLIEGLFIMHPAAYLASVGIIICFRQVKDPASVHFYWLGYRNISNFVLVFIPGIDVPSGIFNCYALFYQLLDLLHR